MWLAFLSFAVTNAYLAHKHRNKERNTPFLEFSDWKENLVWKLFNHARKTHKEERLRNQQDDIPRTLLTRFGMRCTDLTKHPKRTNPHCCVCKIKRTGFYCTCCGPNFPICYNPDSVDCRLVHMLANNSKETWF